MLRTSRFALFIALSALLLSCSDFSRTDPDELEMAWTSSSSSSSSQVSSSSRRAIVYNDTSIKIPVVYRDFSVEFPDVEFYDADSVAMGKTAQCAEDKPGMREVPGAVAICADFKPCVCPPDMAFCTPSSAPTDTLQYGEMLCNGTAKRSYIQWLDNEGCKNLSWKMNEYITYNMVAPALAYDPSKASSADSADYAYPVSLYRNRCHNDHFNQWFTDVEGVNKRVDDMIELTEIDGQFYEFNADWNSDTKGFFPLDNYAGTAAISTWGKQSLSLWCPSSTTLYPDEGCSTWRQKGGPKSPTAAEATVAQLSELSSSLHNYGYTMAMNFRFKYNPGGNDGNGEEIIIHADEAWVFVDGKLVGDLGGAHSPAPLSLNMNQLAEYFGGWLKGSTHTVHLFYAERQTDGATFIMRTNLSGIF